MSAAAARAAEPSPLAALDDAVVTATEIVAGHDGAAELMIRLRHGNGATSAFFRETPHEYASPPPQPPRGRTQGS